jgi:hypothetical protein
MKIENKSKMTILATLIPLPTIFVPLLANMETQIIFGLSNSFWAGFIGASSIVGMIFLLAVRSGNQHITNK